MMFSKEVQLNSIKALCQNKGLCESHAMAMFLRKQNVKSWYVLGHHLISLVPNCLQFKGVLSPQYNVRCPTRGNRDREIPKVDATMLSHVTTALLSSHLLFNFKLHVCRPKGTRLPNLQEYRWLSSKTWHSVGCMILIQSWSVIPRFSYGVRTENTDFRIFNRK